MDEVPEIGDKARMFALSFAARLRNLMVDKEPFLLGRGMEVEMSASAPSVNVHNRNG